MVADFDETDMVLEDDYGCFLTGYPLSKLGKGTYELGAYLMPCNSDGSFADIDPEEYYVPSAFVTFKIAPLKAPAKITATSGKGKVTISFKKAAGAKRTVVYRSTKKGSGYKKIGSTTESKYVDKKAKKGRKYYYKLCSYRPSTLLYSSYSSPERSGTVK